MTFNGGITVASFGNENLYGGSMASDSTVINDICEGFQFNFQDEGLSF